VQAQHVRAAKVYPADENYDEETAKHAAAHILKSLNYCNFT
jgi:hypothetical protein